MPLGFIRDLMWGCFGVSVKRQGACGHTRWVQVLGSGHERPGLVFSIDPLRCVCSKPQLLVTGEVSFDLAQCKCMELTLPGHGSKANRLSKNAACWGMQRVLLVALVWFPHAQLDLHPGTHPAHLFTVPFAFGMQGRDTSPGYVWASLTLSIIYIFWCHSAVSSADLSWPRNGLTALTCANLN